MGGGYLELGNLDGRGVLVVWEIQSEGGGGGQCQKCSSSFGGGGGFFLD